MRAWYHSDSGLDADLCLLLSGEGTRVIIRKGYETVSRRIYPTWETAIESLKTLGHEWINDLTGKPL